MFVQDNQKWKVDTKNKMDNPRFIDDEAISLVHEEDYDDYNTWNTSRVDETSFTEPDSTEATSTLQLRQKVKRDKLTTLYRHLNETEDPGLADIDPGLADIDPGLADIDRYMIKKNQNQATPTCFFSMVNSGNLLLIPYVLVSF